MRNKSTGQTIRQQFTEDSWTCDIERREGNFVVVKEGNVPMSKR